MAETGGGNKDIGNAHRCSLVEEVCIEAGGDPGAGGIEGQNLQGTNEA